MPDIPQEAVKAALAAYRHALYDRPTPTELSDERLIQEVLEAAAPHLAEYAGRQVLKYSDEHEPDPGSLGYLVWHRHFAAAAQAAAGAFHASEDGKGLPSSASTHG